MITWLGFAGFREREDIVGWCSGTQYFDDVLAAALPHITGKAARDRFVYKVAMTFWEGDWDCESDSNYYDEFQHVLDGGDDGDQPWAKDPEEVMHFPPVKTYRKIYDTPAIEYTGHNFDVVRLFCASPALTWGLSDGTHNYGTADTTHLPSNEVCVYDYLHGVWIPFAVGDHIAKGPQGENYPIERKALGMTYREVTVT